MKCKDVRLTEICKTCGVGNSDACCPNVGSEGSTVTYYAPPSTIFELIPGKNHVGEQVICVSAHNCNKVKVGEIFTVVDQKNEQFGYIRLDKFKDCPNMWFGPDRFRKLKATYDGKEYTITLRH